MEVVVSPPPVSSYTLPRGPESPPDIQSIMYSPHSVVDTSINPCNVQIKTEQEAVNFSSNRNFRFGRKETPHLSPRFLTNGTRAPADYPLSTKLGPNQAFTISPSEKKNSMNVTTGGGNPDGYLFGKALETSMENLMKFAEVLYKCTLCTTLPSILTSRDSFISHVNDLHLTKRQSHKECEYCNLKFSTEEDLRAHCRFSHGMETHPGDEIEPTEPSPIDEFTNKSEMEINTENQCTVGDPNKTIQSRTPRFIMESLNAKRRQAALVPSTPLLRVTNSSSPGKETVKSEKIAMEENISRLQQLADQILISNSRMGSGGAGAAGTPTGFHGATSNPSYTPDFGKYTKLIREGGNIVYFCQVCNCKCQVRAAFMSHCSSYQHRGRVEAADRSVAADHSPAQSQSQQNQSTQPPPPAHSHPHSQRHQQNSHPPFHHQQTHQLLLPQSSFKRDHLSCPSSSSLSSSIVNSVNNNSNNGNSINNNNNNNNTKKSNTPGSTNYSNSILNSKKNTLYSGQTSSSSPTQTSPLTTSTSLTSAFTNTTSSSSSSSCSSSTSSSSNNTNTSLPSTSPSPISPSSAEASRTSKSPSEDRALVASPTAVRPTPPGSGSGSVTATGARKTPAASPTPDDHPGERSPTPGPTSEPASDCELDKDGQRKRPRGDTSSDVDSNCDREVMTRQRRKRHAPVAVRQPQVTTSWSDSDSEEETVCAKKPKKSIEGNSDEEDNNNNNNNSNNNNNDNKNNNNSNNNNNDDDNTGSTSTSSSSSSSSGSSSSHNNNSDSSHKGSSNNSNTSSNSNGGCNSSNNTPNNSNNTIQSSTDTRTNTQADNEHPQPGDKAANEDLDSQPKGSPDTGRKSPRSPLSSPALTQVPTPEQQQRADDTPVDFSMTEVNCSNLPQNTDSLGMLSSVVEGFLVSKNQAPVSFGPFDKSPGTANSLTSIKSEPDERADSDPAGLRGIYRCSFCDFVCYDIRDYEEHYVKEHDPDLLDVTLTDTSGKTVHGEYWKMLKVKDILPELLVGCAKGYVSRDILLQKISLLLNIPEVVHWGPACNKAVREEFPNSLAQRKGKFKKTYYFGVALIEQLQEQEELSDSDNVTYQPLRDLAQDLEKILQFLPELVFWTGDLDVGISRDEVLQLLGEKIEETGVQYWGVQCNRAMRFLFPSIHMKRKGKFKTTVYFGVDFMKNITRQIPQAFDSDQTMYIKSEPLDDSYDSVEPKSLHPEMTCAIFPTSVPLVVPTSPSSTSTAVATRSYSTGIE